MTEKIRKAIIFGVNSQDGYYLTKSSLKRKIDVIGVSRSSGNWISGDVSDYSFVENIINTSQPDYIFHIAAKSTTKHFALIENHNTISTGSLNILEAVKNIHIIVKYLLYAAVCNLSIIRFRFRRMMFLKQKMHTLLQEFNLSMLQDILDH